MPHAPTTEVAPAPLDALRRRLADAPNGVLESVATEAGQSFRTVVECLPERFRAFAPGTSAETVMTDIAEWGPVTVLMHSADLVLECKGALPLGQFGHGYYNLQSGSPIGGHIRLDRCVSIGFLRRPFMGANDSCAVIFFNPEGEAMFKVFVGRDDKRQLLADQVARFCSLQARVCNGGDS